MSWRDWRWMRWASLVCLYGQDTPYLRDFAIWQQRYMYDLGLIIGGGHGADTEEYYR